MRLEVVVASVRPATIGRLLESIMATGYGPGLVTVVSNEVEEDILGLPLPVRLIRFDSDFYPVGFRDAALRRNIGIWVSEADAIVFLDDDQIVPPSIFVDVADRLGNADYVWGHHRFIDFTAHSPHEIAALSFEKGRPRENPVPGFHGWQSCYAGMFAAKRELLINIGGFDMQFAMRHASEDQHLGRRLLDRYQQPKAYIHEPPFAWHPEVAEPWTVARTNLCDAHEHYIDTINGARLSRCRNCAYLMVETLNMEPQLVLPFELAHVELDMRVSA